MTIAPADLEQPPLVPAEPPSRRGLRFPLWGWIPPVLTAAVATPVLAFYDVPPIESAKFAAYLLLVIMVPGTLLWRALCGGSRGFVLDVAAGSVLGYALEVLAYIAARWAGRPLLAFAVPAAIVVAFVAVPRLWRFWRGSGERVPVWWAWLLSVAAGFLLAWSAGNFYRLHGLDWPGNGSPYIDLPFHLALAGEVRHHVPPMIPYVRGESLNYHWFVYADLAAVNSATGIELQTLLFRFSMLPMLVLYAVLTAVVARRITGRWWTGPVAVAVTLFALAPSPYAWSADPVASGLTLTTLWLSPTQTFGAMICAGTLLVLVDLLRGPPVRPRWGRWVVLGVLLLVLAGAKATFLPMLLCGLLVVIVGRLVAAREVNWPGLGAFAMTALALVFAQAVLFAGSAGGLVFEPLGSLRDFSIAITTGLEPALSDGDVAPTATVLVIALICWSAAWAGGFGLLARWRRSGDAGVLLLIGVAVAGIGAAMAFTHPGGSQYYFFQSARPALGVVFAAGLAALLPRRGSMPPGASPTRIALLLTAAGAVGAATVWLLGSTGGPAPSVEEHEFDAEFALRLGWPYLLILALAGLLHVALRLSGRRWAVGATGAAAAAAVFLAGGAVPPLVRQLDPTFRVSITDGWRFEPKADAKGRIWRVIPAGAMDVGRWVRDHSDPDDLVATNVHCLPAPASQPCNSRHFWVAAYTERRVLVEGWAYTSTAHERSTATEEDPSAIPFWDANLLAANDEVFTRPSLESVGRLRDEYGVRWLVVDRRYNRPDEFLSFFADLRMSVGDTDLYELTPDASRGADPSGTPPAGPG